jgi:hypothetical protein
MILMAGFDGFRWLWGSLQIQPYVPFFLLITSNNQRIFQVYQPSPEFAERDNSLAEPGEKSDGGHRDLDLDF